MRARSGLGRRKGRGLGSRGRVLEGRGLDVGAGLREAGPAGACLWAGPGR